MEKGSIGSKRRVIRIAGLIVLTIITILAVKNMRFLRGSLWHLTHSSEVRYNNVKVKIPPGWFPVNRRGRLALVKYSIKDGSLIILTSERVEINLDPKEVMESIGRSFKITKITEDYLIDGKKALRIASVLADGRYAIDIFMPEQNLSISYSGPQHNIVDFNRIIEGVTINGTEEKPN